MNETRKLLHSNVLKTKLDDYKLEVLDSIDTFCKSTGWCMIESSSFGNILHTITSHIFEKAFLYPGIRIVVVSSAFRESKQFILYIEELIKGKDIVSVFHNSDEYKLSIGASTIIARPIGSGDKIRGERAHIIVFPHFISIPKDIFGTIVAGFGIVQDPNKKETQFPSQIILCEKTSDIDLDLYEEYNKYRKEALKQDCLIKIKKEMSEAHD